MRCTSAVVFDQAPVHHELQLPYHTVHATGKVYQINATLLRTHTTEYVNDRDNRPVHHELQLPVHGTGWGYQIKVTLLHAYYTVLTT